MLTHRRIKEVLINSEFSWWKDDYQEFYFNLNKARLTQEDIQPIDLFASINPVFGKDIYTGTIVVNEETEKLKLSSRQSQEYDVWSMQYVPQTIDGKPYKLAELASVEKGQMPQKVCKVNQQYRLCLQYEYIGASNQGNKIQERDLKEINAILPMGYTAKSESAYWYWDKKDNKQSSVIADHRHYLLYHQYPVQFAETALGRYLCNTDLLHWRIPHVLLVQIEFRPRRICLLRPVVRHNR